MWNIGITAMFTESLSNFHESVTFITPEKKLEFVSMTPFGSPVVPDVYIWIATSPGCGSAPGSVAGCAPRNCS